MKLFIRLIWLISILMLTATLRLASAHVAPDDMAVLGDDIGGIMQAYNSMHFHCCNGDDVAIVHQRRVTASPGWSQCEIEFPPQSNVMKYPNPPEAGKWYPVPAWAIVKENIETHGEAVAWWYPMGAASKSPISAIHCFIPGIEV